MKCFVTGCAGFVGSNLVDRLLAAGHGVVGYDRPGCREDFLVGARRNPRFALVSGDVLDGRELAAAMAGSDLVFHLAANADVRFARENPRAHFEQNALATFWVLEAMRGSGARRIVFSSTGVVYGEPDVFPTPENVAFPVQTSLYGAAKLASEALIQAYCAGFGFQGYIFRMVSLLGERYTHGLIIDCYKKLLANPHEIELLGNGQQRKSYLYVQDAIDAILLAIEEARAPVNIFNLGSDEYCTVDQSVDWICQQLALNPRRKHAGGERGWIGDSPFVFLDCARIRSFGWKPRRTIREAVLRTLAYLQENPHLL